MKLMAIDGLLLRFLIYPSFNYVYDVGPVINFVDNLIYTGNNMIHTAKDIS